MADRLGSGGYGLYRGVHGGLVRPVFVGTGAGDDIAALGLAFFTGSMAAVRLGGDLLINRWGPLCTIRRWQYWPLPD